VCCASAGAERRGGVLCADPAYVVIPQAKKKPCSTGHCRAAVCATKIFLFFQRLLSRTLTCLADSYAVRGHSDWILTPLDEAHGFAASDQPRQAASTMKYLAGS
jgi:hypothetical protein